MCVCVCVCKTLFVLYIGVRDSAAMATVGGVSGAGGADDYWAAANRKRKPRAPPPACRPHPRHPDRQTMRIWHDSTTQQTDMSFIQQIHPLREKHTQTHSYRPSDASDIIKQMLNNTDYMTITNCLILLYISVI